jgi:hypothetical protein
MDFNQFQGEIESCKVVLAEIKPAIDLSIMTLSTGSNTYYMPIEKISSGNSGFYFHPQFEEVREDGIGLTHVIGSDSVEQTAGSWYFDEGQEKIFVHTLDSTPPSNHSILGIFPLYFSNQAITTEDHCYNPRISDVPISISGNAEDIYFSSTTVGGGCINFDNSDSFFDRLSCKYIWKNRDISIALGEKEMTVASYATIFTGRLRDRKMTDKQVSFSIQDKREYLHKNLPERLFSKKDYPNLDTSYENKPIPTAYGFFEKAPAFKIDTTAKGVFKFIDHPVLEVLYVYNNGIAISSTHYTVNLDLGEVTILTTYGSTVGQIAVTFYGVPGENILYIDDFNDGDIDGWTYQATGGTFSWTPLNQKVRAACQDGYSTFLWTQKKFSRGQIEVKIKPIAGTSNYYSQGIVWDYDDIDNFKYLVLHPVLDKIRIIERNNGTTTVWANTDIALDIGTEYTLKLEVGTYGNTSGYLNGEKVITHDFAAHPSFKSCGLIQLNGETTDFDDFSIALPYLSTGPAIIKDICTRWLGISEGDLNAASFANAAEKARERIHLYLGSSQERSEQTITRIGISNLCRFLIGADGKVHYSFWDENDNVSISISEEMLLDTFESYDQTDDIFYKVKLNYGATPLNPAGTDEEYSEENIKYTYERPYEKRFISCLVDTDDAETIALKLFQLVKSPVLRVKIQTKVPGINAKVGDILELKRNRGFSLSGSLNGRYRIIGITKEIDLARTTLTLVSENDALGIDICAQTCQYGCESSCLGHCEIVCQDSCEVRCQSICQLNCQTTCEINCETTCEITCQDTCEATCQEACELVCKTICETSCQGACQLACQAGCEEPCTTFCETHNQE